MTQNQVHRDYAPGSKKIRLLLSYDGTHFGGWQKQTSEKPTVQGELEKHLSQFFNQKIRVIGSGRTDAGVHALAQNAHFIAPKPFREDRLVTALNKMLNTSISVLGAWECPMDFHALGSSIGKVYKYNIWNDPIPNPLLRPYSWWLPHSLDLKKLQECSKYFEGKHDFSSFQTSGSEVLTTVRTLHSVTWKRHKQRLTLTLHGEGFLKQMVRNIVGLQIDILRQNRSPSEIQDILNARTRQAAGSTAPPEGLFLVKVLYPRELDNQCRKL